MKDMLTEEQLTQVVAELKKAQGFQIGAWQRVQAVARKYAQMKTFGTYIDHHSHTVSVGFNDRESMTDQYRLELLREAERAFAEDAQAGIAFSQAVS